MYEKLIRHVEATVIRLRMAVAVLLLVFTTGSAHAGLFGDAINLEFTVQNERGEPIPYVTLWRCEEPHKVLSFIECGRETLWRMTEHYQRSFEFATPFHSPINMLSVPVMLNERGVGSESLKPETIFGRNGKHPERINLYYTFMKHGYQPAKVDFEQMEWGAHKKVTVTLQRDSKITDADKPYLKEYDRVRYFASNPAQNEARTTDNSARLEGLREQLEKLAQDALRDGNKPAAARIYARMQVLPEIMFVNGKVVGFSQSEPKSPRNLEALAKAYELDPAHPYIAGMYFMYRIELARERDHDRFYGARAKTPIDFKQYTELGEAHDKLGRLVTERGDEVWPWVYHALATLYSDGGEYENGYRTILRLYKTEPAYMNYESLVPLVTRGMSRRGIAYPPEWLEPPDRNPRADDGG